jgi:hypothetical protein
MNLKQINLFREIIKFYEVSDISKNANINVGYAKDTLNTLENRIPTDRQLELQSNIIDFKYNIKKREHILKNLDFYEADDGCSEINGICDYEHLIEEAEKELKDIHVKKVFS